MARGRGALVCAVVAGIVAVTSATAAPQKQHRAPLTFRWPTSVVVRSSYSLLVVENGGETAPGRVVRVNVGTGKRALVLEADGAYALARAPSGAIYLSAGTTLLRLGRGGSTTTVAEADEDIGPVAVAANGDVFYTTSTAAWRLAGGAGTPEQVASGLANPHGLAVTFDGGLLVGDTDNGQVKRIDLGTSAVETWGSFQAPRGIAITADGQSAYVADGATRRVVRVRIDGLRLGVVKHRFSDPYAVAVTPHGSVYVVDTAEAGHVYRVGWNRTITSVSR